MLKLVYHDVDYRYGYHMSKYPTLQKTIEKALQTPLRAFQIYIANSRSYKAPKLEPEDILIARKMLAESQRYLCIHSCLLYNLCGAKDGKCDKNYDLKLQNTIAGLTKELDIGVGLDVGVVVHIGTAVNRKKGLRQITRTLKTVLTQNTTAARIMSKKLGIEIDEFISRRRIILENCAGERNKIGNTLEEIGSIIQSLPEELHKQVSVCIDTAHAFGAGQYDWGKRKEINRFYEEFDRYIGMEFLELFHLNDSKVPFGKCVDRHENLAKGYAFGDLEGDMKPGKRLRGLRHFLQMMRKHGIAAVGEPPESGMTDWSLVMRLTEKDGYPMIREVLVDKSKVIVLDEVE